MQIQSCSRIDIVWDTTQEKEGKRIRKNVSRNAKLHIYFAGLL